ncbi:hypothetical protein Trco_000409 [Trichoderma cornu-damae]|uniref:Uncharacterized protein n=1 Tax=Trichoderma cornu-damae TaxID=654480 RepID=A0A9P8U0B2_9HYPO|nr:hypothetical protein Trco_000409 [Trichoderma cornu-damae]
MPMRGGDSRSASVVMKAGWGRPFAAAGARPTSGTGRVSGQVKRSETSLTQDKDVGSGAPGLTNRFAVYGVPGTKYWYSGRNKTDEASRGRAEALTKAADKREQQAWRWIKPRRAALGDRRWYRYRSRSPIPNARAQPSGPYRVSAVPAGILGVVRSK